jgi:hypothetical protein
MQTENCGNLAEGSVINAVCNSTATPSVKMKMVMKMLNGSQDKENKLKLKRIK